MLCNTILKIVSRILFILKLKRCLELLLNQYKLKHNIIDD